MRSVKTLLYSIVALGIGGTVSAQQPQPASPTPSQLVVDVPMDGAWAEVPVTINGDTGRLGVGPGTPMSIRVVDGRLGKTVVSKTDTLRLDSLIVGGTVVRGETFDVLWLRRQDFRGMLHPVIGTAGPKFLSHFDVAFDFAANRLRLYTRPETPITPGAAWLPPGIRQSDCVRAIAVENDLHQPQPPLMPLAEALVNGKPVHVSIVANQVREWRAFRSAAPMLGIASSAADKDAKVPNVRISVAGYQWKDTVHYAPQLEQSAVGRDSTLLSMPIVEMPLPVPGRVVFFSNSSGQICISKP